jgi:hypothetical protein
MSIIIPESPYELLDHIKAYLNDLISKSDKSARIYFSGECDSNQTTFEYASNNISLGVICPDEKAALILLRFLRYIIDDRGDMFLEDTIYDYDTDKYLTTGTSVMLEDIIDGLASKELCYMRSCALDDVINTNFIRKEHNFTKKLHEIDIWTLVRVMSEMRDLDLEQ